MMAGLAGRVVLVAGASSGMGRATALRLGADGAIVYVAARRGDACEAVAAGIRADGGVAHALAMDGTSEDSVAAAMAAIAARHGRLDAAFNNLGASGGAAAVDGISPERWRGTLETNLTAPFLLMRAEVPLMEAAGGGVIINNASAGGLRGTQGLSDYAAAKWGLIGLTKSAALDLGPRGIRVNVIAPGIIETEKMGALAGQMPALFETLKGRIALGRFGAMDEVAALVAWLMSDEARFIHGAVLPIDGGQTA